MLLHVDMDFADEADCPLSASEIEELCEMVLVEEGVGRPCFLSLSVVGEQAIRARNREWRGVDASTDVISIECERPDDPDLAPDEPCELGDIFIAPAYVARQAERVGTTWADELRLMLIHGMLHLLGYDHVEEDEALVMEAREDELLGRATGDGQARHVRLTRHRGGDQA